MQAADLLFYRRDERFRRTETCEFEERESERSFALGEDRKKAGNLRRKKVLAVAVTPTTSMKGPCHHPSETLANGVFVRPEACAIV